MKTTKKNTKKTTEKIYQEFVNSEGGNKKLREKIWKFCEDNNINLVMLEPGVFDGGIKRWGKKKDGLAVVYDYEKTAEALAEDYLKFNDSKKADDKDKIEGYDFDAAYLDAVEWIDYNTIRSLPYCTSGIRPRVVYINPETEKEEDA